MENSISKNFEISGQTVTHEYLPEMDVVCGYIQLEFEGENNVIPVYATLYDYELILFEDDTVNIKINNSLQILFFLNALFLIN